MGSFELYIFSFGLMSFDLCTLFARILVGLELLLGLGLASSLWRRTVNWCSLAMISLFSLFLIWRAIKGDEESCHCFGELVDMNPAQSLIKNAVLAVLLALGWKGTLPWLKNPKLRVAIPLIAASATFTTIFAANPPDFYFRLTGHESSDLMTSKWEPYCSEYGYDDGREVVMFMSPYCEFCARCATIMTSMARRDNIPMDRMHIVFLEATEDPQDMYLLVPMFFDENTYGVQYDFRVMNGDEFLSMTNGVMPLVCLFDDGVLEREFDLFSLDEAFISSFLSEDGQ